MLAVEGQAVTWLLIINNGGEYSDNCHEPIMATRTEAEAIAAKASWDEWYSRIPRLDRRWPHEENRYSLDRNWVKANPPPIGAPHEKLDGWYFEDTRTDLGIMEVPDWATET